MQNEELAKVLLVDDEPLILSAYRRALNVDGTELVIANSPIEALGILEKQPIDVVLADYRMPEMNGDAFLEKVRAGWPDTVRILVTAYADVRIVEEAVRRGGIFRFLTKPCDTNKLVRALREAIEQRQNAKEHQQRSKKLELDLHSYEHLFQSTADPMIIADLDGFVIEVNQAFVRNAGQTVEDALRRRPHVFKDIKQWRSVRAQLDRAGLWSDEVCTGDRYIELSLTPIRDDLGKTYAYAAIERDVTTTRKLDEATRSAQYEVIFALARLAEYRDPETGAHLERMRRYSRIVAAQLSKNPKHSSVIDEAYVEALFHSSPLHDIGKVGIPDNVLLKPGKLTADEWEIMKTHAEIGAEVLSVTGDRLSEKAWLSMARTIALQHHEKIDGSGYPKGLSGNEIDLSARIVALADAYDAITSKRVYKNAIPHDEAKKRIIESAGTHFDHDVVEAFLAREDKFIEVRNQYADGADPKLQTNTGYQAIRRRTTA